MAKATITLYEGKSKASGKPFTALKLQVGEWSSLYFPDSRFEMDYIKKQLKQPTAQEKAEDDFFSGAND